MRQYVVLALLLSCALSVSAQLKPPPSVDGPASKPPIADPVVEAKEAAAAQAAAEWLKLIDTGEYGRAWDSCAPLFREKVTRQQWVDGVPKNRAEYGKFNSRKLGATAYRQSLPGAPDGDYVTVRFLSDYEKNASADEIVTMMYQSGAWRPVGYLLR